MHFHPRKMYTVCKMFVCVCAFMRSVWNYSVMYRPTEAVIVESYCVKDTCIMVFMDANSWSGQVEVL